MRDEKKTKKGGERDICTQYEVRSMVMALKQCQYQTNTKKTKEMSNDRIRSASNFIATVKTSMRSRHNMLNDNATHLQIIQKFKTKPQKSE